MLEQKEIINKCAAFIREHCKEEMSAELLAERFGYSVYHLSRTFREIMGVPMMEYVKQQRLSGAARAILGGQKILDAALDYGYETHSGFTKAFQAAFGCSPALLRAYKGIYLIKTDIHAKPEALFAQLWVLVQAGQIDITETKLREVYGLAVRLCGTRRRKSGDPYVTHPLSAAVILTDMGADGDTVCAGLLHDIWELSKEPEAILKEEAVTPDMADILKEYRDFRAGKSIDERAVLVALADRLHNMRTVEFMDLKVQREKAEETMEVFAPLAARCGNIKCRLEFDEISEKYRRLPAGIIE